MTEVPAAERRPLPPFINQRPNPNPAPMDDPDSHSSREVRTVSDGLDVFRQIQRQRDDLVQETHAQALELARQRSEIDSLKRSNDQLAHERDFYMRHCTEITTQLNSIQMTINDAVQRARDLAYRPNGAAPRQEKQIMGQEDLRKLERVVSNFSPEKAEGEQQK